MLTVFKSISPAKPTIVYDAYWKFAAERQEIFFRRFNGFDQSEWTDDPIFSKYKFTNAYRASDRVSQFLIKNVIYDGPQDIEETFFRILLFKTFNRIDTWEMLKEKLGEITFRNFSFRKYDQVLSRAMRAGKRIYSAAYIMTSGYTSFGYRRKHQNHLRLIELMMRDEVPKRISETKMMREVFDLLRSYPTIGDFLAYQYSIDINYSEITNFSEMEFVMPGPGALDGIYKCFRNLGGLNEVEIIKLMAENQFFEFEKRGIEFKSLWGRPLQLIDCQNIFCEISKYARAAFPSIKGVTGRLRIKQTFKPNLSPIEYWYPPKWELNERING